MTQSEARTQERPLDPIRADFAFPPTLTYFNSASCALPPSVVLDAMNEYYTSTPVNYRSGETPLEAQVTERVNGIRAAMARFLHAASPREVVFTKNTTEAINVVAQGLAWSPGDEVVVTPLEHQSNLIPWMRLADRAGVVVRFVRPSLRTGLVDPGEVALLVGPRTRLVSVHHVSNLLGCVQDVAAIAEVTGRHGVLLMLDAAQSEGRVEVDVEALGCDLLVSCARKGLMGPQGVGFLYGREEVLGGLEPLAIGGQAAEVLDPSTYRSLDLPFRHEAGIPNTAGLVGLGAALDYVEGLGMGAIAGRIGDLSDHLLAGLRDLPGVTVHGQTPEGHRSGIVSWTFDGLSPRAAAHRLYAEAGIVVGAGTCGSPLAAELLGVDGVVRVSVHCFNSHDEVDTLLGCVASFQGS